jgi:phage/plasmid-like protein (TIGR03299 family)
MSAEMDNIANIDGQDAIGYTKQGGKPWHHKGTQVPGLMTVTQALIAGRLDWEVQKIPLMTADTDMVIIPNTYATGRRGPEKNEDDSLRFVPFEGSVKGRYTIVQNVEAFDFFNKAIDDGVACIETVGALGKGETVWAMAKLPNDFEVAPGDPIERYILLSNSHDGSGSICALFSPIRVVCWNTLSAAIAGATNMVKIRHTKSAHKRMEQLHKLLNASDTFWDRLKAAYRNLMLRDMTQLEVIEFIEKMFPGKREKVKQVGGGTKVVETVPTRTLNNRNKVKDLFEGSALGSDKAGKTHWGMYNAYTEYLDSHRSIRKTSDSWEATTFGSGTRERQKAFDLLIGQAAS